MLYIFFNPYITNCKGEEMGLKIKKTFFNINLFSAIFISFANFRRNLKKFRNFYKDVIYFF